MAVEGAPADPTARTWRRLGHELTHAGSIEDVLKTVGTYGWAPAFCCLFVAGLSRGVFEFLTEPYAMSQRYAFAGWELAFAINLLFGIAFLAFTWFLFFGVIGSLAGFLSKTTRMDATVFKVGGYVALVFVPVLVVGSLLAVTVSPPEVAIATVDSPETLAETYAVIADSAQMGLFSTLMAGAWVLAGFLMLPVVGELYDLSAQRSVLAVLPVTLVAVTATLL